MSIIRSSESKWNGSIKEGKGFVLPKIDLVTEASVPNIADDEFQQIAMTA